MCLGLIFTSPSPASADQRPITSSRQRQKLLSLGDLTCRRSLWPPQQGLAHSEQAKTASQGEIDHTLRKSAESIPNATPMQVLHWCTKAQNINSKHHARGKTQRSPAVEKRRRLLEKLSRRGELLGPSTSEKCCRPLPRKKGSSKHCQVRINTALGCEGERIGGHIFANDSPTLGVAGSYTHKGLGVCQPQGTSLL